MMDADSDMGDKVLQNKLVMTKVAGVEKGNGEGYYGVMDGETRIYASFMVEKTEPNYFYEGWMVCDGKPYSTGALTFSDGLYENIFVSSDKSIE